VSTVRSCIAAIGCGGLIVAAAAVGWLARDEMAGFVSSYRSSEGASEALVETSVSAGSSLATRVEEKIVALGQGESEEVTLSVEELNGWIAGGLTGYFPDYISGVLSAIEDERLVLTGDVVVKEVPGIERLGPVLAFMGDTANVRVRGRLDGLGPGRGVYFVDDVRVGMLPLPESARDELLMQLKRGIADDLPVNAVPFLLPRFVADVGVRGNEIFLRR